MAFLFRWLMRAVLALSFLALVAAGLAYYLAGQSLPDYDADYRIEGPRAEIEIVRDAFAVPHVLAGSDADAFFGLGFVHAQDRLWQMTLMRRTAQGRLSELFGPETVEIDGTMRALDIYALAQQAARDQAPETQAALEAYAAGVNAWLRVVQDRALGRGAPEFFLFDAAIAPWVPADSLAVQKLMALQLTDKAAMETLRAQLSLALKPERLRDILPDAPNAPTMSLPEFSQAPAGGGRVAARHPLDPVPQAGGAGASNAFAVAGSRAAGGAPLLATDPHLKLTAPGIWMLARLDLAAGPVIGATIPGIPAVLIGRNDDIGWGLTASYADDQDLHYERLNPEDPEEYLTPTGFKAFASREIRIGVKGEDPVTRTLRWTRNGPVLPAGQWDVGAVTPPGHVMSLAWTALAAEDRSVGAAIALMRAGSVAAAREAAQDYLAPSLNLTLADRDGIAIQTIGRIPARQAGHTSLGRLPSPGWRAVNEWRGFLPYDSNPAEVDPPGGVVVNTNNRIEDGDFPRHLSFDWGDAYRIIRATRLLNAREFHTLESMIEIQTDIVSEPARVLLPLIARDLWYAGAPAAEGTDARRRQVALERLADWNGAMSEHLPEPLIYAAWLRALQRRVALDELGPQFNLLVRPDPLFLERVFRNVDGAGEWCDIVQSARVETCADMAGLALDDALIELVAAYGPRLESWRWGDAHQALHRNQTMGEIPVLRHLVNIRQSTAGGDDTLLRGMTAGTGPEPYRNVHASGFRAVYDFADPDASVFIAATGESGHLLSRHYDDLSALWRRSDYIPMSLDPSLARAGAIGITRLMPLEE